VKISETVGDITEKTLLITRIRTIKNEEITIPNAMILGSHIINYSTSAQDLGLILHTTVTIGYDAPWRTVHELLIAAALATEGVLDKPAPFVLQTSLDDSFVSYQINAYSEKPNEMAVIYARLHENIQDKFNEAGIEIMSPHFSALRDGNPPAMPKEAPSHKASTRGFRIAGLEKLLEKSGGEPDKDKG
jgi:small-conductance mechanosensitive channel